MDLFDIDDTQHLRREDADAPLHAHADAHASNTTGDSESSTASSD